MCHWIVEGHTGKGRSHVRYAGLLIWFNGRDVLAGLMVMHDASSSSSNVCEVGT